MRENQLGNIDPGDEVVVAFDELPAASSKGTWTASAGA
jgi:multidrug resistance efflux pump